MASSEGEAAAVTGVGRLWLRRHGVVGHRRPAGPQPTGQTALQPHTVTLAPLHDVHLTPDGGMEQGKPVPTAACGCKFCTVYGEKKSLCGSF